MDINENSMVPIYVQIADAIEDDILSGKLEEGESCYSQLVLAKELHVNAKKLVEDRKRKEEMTKIVDDLVCWGKRLSMSKQEVIELIEEKYKEIGQ